MTEKTDDLNFLGITGGQPEQPELDKSILPFRR